MFFNCNNLSLFDAASNICVTLLAFGSIILIILTFPVSIFTCIKVIKEYERGVVFRLGRVTQGRARGPGIIFIIPCIDTFTKVDIRTVSFEVPSQEILTKDSVTVSVDAVVYYHVWNATAAVTKVENYGRSTRLLAATTLRNTLGTKTLSEILSDGEATSHSISRIMDEATNSWGVKVERIEMKNIRLPDPMQGVFAREAKVSRDARAKVIASEGEQESSQALKEAADVLTGR